jgi:hypothetical protein
LVSKDSYTSGSAKIPLDTYMQYFSHSAKHFSDLSLARKRLSYYRWNIVKELEKHLFEFESNVKRTGGVVMWGGDVEESRQQIKFLAELPSKIAYIPEKNTDELGLETNYRIPTLSKYISENAGLTPDILFVPVKFIVSSTGHIFFASNNASDYLAVCQAKQICFVCGIDAIVQNAYELELSKNLYSLYETGKFGYHFEMLSKPGKPESRFQQHVHLLITDHHRSSFLLKEHTRKFFPLLNFQFPSCAVELFWSNLTDIDFFQSLFFSTTMIDKVNDRDGYFKTAGLPRIEKFLPYDIDVYSALLEGRQLFGSPEKPSLLTKLMSVNHAKVLLQSSKKLSNKKFSHFLKNKILGNSFQLMPEKESTFIEQYYYEKRKI